MEIDNSYDSLGEKLLDYFELVEVYDRKKLFILVNLRSYLSETEMAQFVKSVIAHQYALICIHNMPAR
jgi:CRISPR-associated protein Csn2